MGSSITPTRVLRSSSKKNPQTSQSALKTRALVHRGAKPDPKKLSLDQLPVEILQLIVEYLPQSGLVTCCLVSKTLYWLSVGRLYRSISIVQESYLEDLSEIPVPVKNGHSFSVVPLKKRLKLLATVKKNNVVAGFIQSLSIAEILGDTPFPRVSQFLKTFLSHVRLEYFHCMELYSIPRELIESVQRLACNVVFQSAFPRNLVELKIIYRGFYIEILHFEELALDLIQQNSYQNLKILGFETRDYRPTFKQVTSYQLLEKGHPFWLDFFLAFSGAGIQLNLTSLQLNGEFWDSAEDFTADTLSQAVDLSHLKTFGVTFSHYIFSQQLNVNEYHPHEAGSHGFLTCIARYLHSLQNLSITHTAVCSNNDIDALCRVLRESLPNQLKQLDIHLSGQFWSILYELRLTILSHQRNLVKLKLNHWPFWRCFRDCTFEMAPQLHLLMVELIKKQDLLHILVPTTSDVDPPRAIMKDKCIGNIKANKQIIKYFLQADAIYSHAPRDLPLLAEYIIMGIYVNMKSRTILNNGIMLRLDE